MRAPELRLFEGEIIVDNFAGGGGASVGIEMALGRSPDIAINHDAEAVAMHAANHPNTKHYCEDVWDIDPVKVCAGRPVGLAWFSPDCKHFSKAKGAKPVEKRIRGLAWIVVKWAKSVKPRVIILENVEEFADWGPLIERDGKMFPDPLKKGLTFRRWIGNLRSLGYEVDWQEMAACDYGAPTTRKRLFLVARCDGKPIVWPKPTHSEGGHGGLKPWRTAAECIDFSIPTHSIFLTPEEARKVGVKRPLADNTMRRIARGIKKFVIDSAKPFIVPITHTGDDRCHSIDEPLRTITSAKRGEFSLLTPFVARTAHSEVSANSKRWGNGEHRIADPLPTVAASKDFALISPTLIQTGYGEREGQQPRVPGLDKPLGTVVAGGQKHGLVSAFLAKHYGGNETPGSPLSKPVDTITSQDHNALVAAHVSPMYGLKGNETRNGDLFDPLPTVTADPRHALVSSNLVKLKGTCQDGQAIDEPLHTIQAGGNHYAEVRAFLIKYHATGGQMNSLHDPMPTIMATDSIGIVMVDGHEYVIVDIGMRMLVPRELFNAQGLPPDYIIDIEVNGRRLPKDAQVRMVGNSVSPYPACALVMEQFAEQKDEAVA